MAIHYPIRSAEPLSILLLAAFFSFHMAASYAQCTVCAPVSISGSIFDDANGNGSIDGSEAAGSLGQTLYAVLSDSTGTIAAVSAIAANGSFLIDGIQAYTHGYHVYVSDTIPLIGSAASGYMWPSGRTGTLGQYGRNNTAGTGIDGFTGAMIPVSTDSLDVSGLLIGFDRLPSTGPQQYDIGFPDTNSARNLISASGLGSLAGHDPENGNLGVNNVFTISDLSGLNGNALYYDQNGDGVLEPYELITNYTLFTEYTPSKLYIKFKNPASLSATFSYNAADAAGMLGQITSTYTINWTGTLPVRLEYFTATSASSSILLRWVTASETGNAYFDVERSADAEDWESIGKENGAGNTDAQTDYAMTDQHPMAGTNYYRLKQVNVDGSYIYSEIAAATCSETGENAVVMYPNPVSSGSALHLAMSGLPAGIAQVTISDQAGEQVYSAASPVPASAISIGGLDLAAGIYTVSVNNEGQARTTGSRLVVR